jgi:hypothetical protein
MKRRLITRQRARYLIPLVAVTAFCAGCSSSPPAKPGTATVPAKVAQPANCQLKGQSALAPHPSIGIKATARSGVTSKQIGAAVVIPDDKTMPCASGADYQPGTPVKVEVFFLKGVTTANEQRAAATLKASKLFSVVTVVPQP